MVKPFGRRKLPMLVRIVYFVAAEPLLAEANTYGGVCTFKYKRVPEELYGGRVEDDDKAGMGWLDFDAAYGVKARDSDVAALKDELPKYIKLKFVEKKGLNPVTLGNLQDSMQVERGITYHGLICQLWTKHKGVLAVHVPGTGKVRRNSPCRTHSRAEFFLPRPSLVNYLHDAGHKVVDANVFRRQG
jgi:hypothetical protein